MYHTWYLALSLSMNRSDCKINSKQRTLTWQSPSRPQRNCCKYRHRKTLSFTRGLNRHGSRAAASVFPADVWTSERPLKGPQSADGTTNNRKGWSHTYICIRSMGFRISVIVVYSPNDLDNNSMSIIKGLRDWKILRPLEHISLLWGSCEYNAVTKNLGKS